MYMCLFEFSSKCSSVQWYIEVSVYWFLESYIFNVYQVSLVYIQIGVYKFHHYILCLSEKLCIFEVCLTTYSIISIPSYFEQTSKDLFEQNI